MGKHSLKNRMPRVLADHRCTEAKRLREVYIDLIEKVPNPTGKARRMALLAAQSWVSYEDLSIKIDRFTRNKRSALELRRLRKEKRIAVGHHLAALRELEMMAAGNGRPSPSVKDLLNLPLAGGEK